MLLSFWKNFLILILIESSLDSWIFSLESWSWFLELESWNLILVSWNQISSWTLKCSWFNLELILWFLRSFDLWAFCHHLCHHQNFSESFLIHHEACFYTVIMEVAYGRYASIFTIHDLKALTLHLKSFSPNLNSDFLY